MNKEINENNNSNALAPENGQMHEKEKAKSELDAFEKMHSKTFMYFLEQYEKWQHLKRGLNNAIERINATDS